MRVEPIEDATTLWPDELTSYEDVARITIPVPQAPDAPEAIEHCEKLAFTPFHSLAAHRPIGGINRLRHEVYESSATHRRLPLFRRDAPGGSAADRPPGGSGGDGLLNCRAHNRTGRQRLSRPGGWLWRYVV